MEFRYLKRFNKLSRIEEEEKGKKDTLELELEVLEPVPQCQELKQLQDEEN